jgi:hypothetical protein
MMVNTQQLSYYQSVSPSKFYNNMELDNFVLFTISPDLEFLAKLAISQTEHFWKNFTKRKVV